MFSSLLQQIANEMTNLETQLKNTLSEQGDNNLNEDSNEGEGDSGINKTDWMGQMMDSIKMIGQPKFPSVDIIETFDSITVKAEIPGMDREQIKVTLKGKYLTLHGTRKNSVNEFNHFLNNEKYTLRECHTGPFERSLLLPQEVNKEEITASYQQGILKIVLPKINENPTSENIYIEIK